MRLLVLSLHTVLSHDDGNEKREDQDSCIVNNCISSLSSAYAEFNEDWEVFYDMVGNGHWIDDMKDLLSQNGLDLA